MSSRIKELRNRPENCINLIDMLSLICPEGKTKYVETLLRIMRSSEKITEHKNDSLDFMENEFGIDKSVFAKSDVIEIIHTKQFFESLFEVSDVKLFIKFCDYNERNLIPENDLSKYRSFIHVESAVNMAEIKLTEKEMESQIIRLYEDEEWLVLKPLTYESSRKYGSNTKWCTTQENNQSHFDKYAKGILIYSLNKKTNVKVATYKDLNGEEFSFWNSTDQKIDSMDSDLSFDVLKLIRTEAKTCKTGNLSLKK